MKKSSIKKRTRKKLLINELKHHALRFRGCTFIMADGSIWFPILLVFSYKINKRLPIPFLYRLIPTYIQKLFLIRQLSKQKLKRKPKGHDQIWGGLHVIPCNRTPCSSCGVCTPPYQSWPSIFCHYTHHHHAWETHPQHLRPITCCHLSLHKYPIHPPPYCRSSLTWSVRVSLWLRLLIHWKA